MRRIVFMLLILMVSSFASAQIDNPEAEAILITKLGDEYLKSSEYELAIYYYRNALSTYPGYVKTQFQLAQCYRLSLQLDSAEYHYTSIIDNEQDTRYPMSRYHLAMMQLDRNEFMSAQENLKVFNNLLIDNSLHELKRYRDFYEQAQVEIERLNSK